MQHPPQGLGLVTVFDLPGRARALSHRRKDGKSGSQPGAVLPSRGRWVISGDSAGGHSLEPGCLPLASNGERPGMLLDSPLQQRITQHRTCAPCCQAGADRSKLSGSVIFRTLVLRNVFSEGSFMVKYVWEVLLSLRITLHPNMLQALKIHAIKKPVQL